MFASKSISVGRSAYLASNIVLEQNSRNSKSQTIKADYAVGKQNDNGMLESIYNKFDKLAERMSNLQVVLDTGEFVGATSSAYDKQFGRMTGRKERGN